MRPLRRFRDCLLAGLAVLAGALMPSVAKAQANCGAATPLASFPQAESAIAAWERQRQIYLTGSARTAVGADFCRSAQLISEQTGAAPGEIDSAAATALPAYLDRNLSTAPMAPTLASLLAAEVTFRSSPAAPEPRRLGVLRIRYSRSVDQLRVGGVPMAPYPMLMAEIGRHSISGLSRNQIVCSSTVIVAANAPADFTC